MVRHVYEASRDKVAGESEMITLTQFAERIEDGLNAVLNNPEIQFKVWATAGQMTKPVRSGNTVTQFITGNLRSSSSSNDANVLVMGVNGLTLDFSVPVQEPKTNSEQTAEQLARVQNSQYPFLSLIIAAIDGYFQSAQAFVMTDASDQTEYTVAMQAGTTVTGNVDLAARLGNNVIVSVYITLYFLQGGINSRNVAVYVDGQRLPLQSANIGRVNRNESDVYSGDLSVKNAASASAISIDFAFPANSDNATKEAVSSLLKGTINKAHFVEIDYGTVESEKYFMTFDNLASNPQGVTFAGISGSLIEVVDNPLLLDVPAYMQVGRFEFSSSNIVSFHFSVTLPGDSPILAFIAGDVLEMNDGLQIVNLTAQDFVYDPTDDVYYVYLITNGAVSVSGAGVTFTIVKEASS